MKLVPGFSGAREFRSRSRNLPPRKYAAPEVSPLECSLHEYATGSEQRIFLAETECSGAAHIPPRAARPDVALPQFRCPSLDPASALQPWSQPPPSPVPARPLPAVPQGRWPGLPRCLSSDCPAHLTPQNVLELKILFSRVSGTMNRKREKMRKQLNH